MRMRLLTALGVAMALLALGAPTAAPVFAQTEPQKKDEEAPKDAAKSRPTRSPSATKGNVKPYDEVITDETKTDPGLFLVHRLDDKVFYEVPTELLGKPMLWVTHIERTQAGFGFAGSPVSDRVVRWEQRGEDVLLRDVKFGIRAEAKDPIKDAVAATSVEPIIEVFPVKAYGKDKAPVIEVTSLFTSDLAEFSAKRRLNATGIDSRKTFLDQVKSFPENIEAKVTMTYRASPRPAFGGRGGPSPTPSPSPEPGPDRPIFGGGGGDGSNVTVQLHHSMVKLPDEPMRPRKADGRVGFFTVDFEDYADQANHQVEDVAYVTRWRLEKKTPGDEPSEPKKPIVFYVGREVPDKWRPWIKKGIEMWQAPFEKAGFKNAILAKDAPSLREDPDWDAEDARYSTIRWIPNTTENARGPHTSDPRTGEILQSDIEIYHNVLKLARDWYFVQASPNDPKAQTLPLPDDTVGACLAYVVAHEVGHTLGFPHNMKASSSYTVAQLRDPEFTKKNGVEASIMDYGRFNYVAQPGDNAELIPKIGPYDFFAVEWGYKEFPGAKDYAQEKAELDKIAARQIKDPTLRFGDPNPGEDPSQQTEDLGSDPIAATELGLKNIDRVAGYLLKATSKPGEDYGLLSNMYNQLLGQRNRELGHVANVVGGYVENKVYFGDGDKVYESVPAEQQKKAVAFLNENAFKTPTAMVAPDITQRLEASGAADRVLRGQTGLLGTLLSETRVKRLAEQATREPGNAYAPTALMDDLTGGIFGELKESSVAIDLYRRNLQRAYVDRLAGAVKGASTTSDLPALARGTLARVLTDVTDALGSTDKEKVKDKATRLHLSDLKARIVETLDPRGPAGAEAVPVRVARPFGDD